MSTIKDVAAAAGVSTATVSRVLNSEPGVSTALAARVRASVAALNYRPSRAARTLRTRQGNVWSLVLADIRNPFFTDTICGIEAVAFEAGYSLIIANSNWSPGRERVNLSVAAAERVAGVVLVPTETTATDLDELTEMGVPVVALDRRVRGDGVDCVMTDHFHGSKLAVEHLLGNGYQRIACIAGPADTTSGSDRMAGYRSALSKRGIEVEPVLERRSDFTEDGGYGQMLRLIHLKHRPDAVFVANNFMTIGALRAIADAGLTVPDDIAIVGFDEMSWSRLLNPPITTIGQPTYDLGVEAGRLLLGRIQGYDGAAREIVLGVSLHVRASSAGRPS